MSADVDLLKDLKKKFRLLKGMDAKRRANVLNGLTDGLAQATVPYPGNNELPWIRPSFHPDYEAGYDVGETWAHIANH